MSVIYQNGTFKTISNVSLIKELEKRIDKIQIGGQSGIPIVEELDPNAPVGTIVVYKQNIKINERRIVDKRIRDLNQTIEFDPITGIPNLEKLDVIKDINFKVPSQLPSVDEVLKEAFVLSDGQTIGVAIGVVCDSNGFTILKEGGTRLIYNDEIYNNEITSLKNALFQSKKIYYGGSVNLDYPISEEAFDLFDLSITVSVEENVTQDITKVIPYIKQEYGWESLEIADKDFNNDFNFDFN